MGQGGNCPPCLFQQGARGAKVLFSKNITLTKSNHFRETTKVIKRNRLSERLIYDVTIVPLSEFKGFK